MDEFDNDDEYGNYHGGADLLLSMILKKMIQQMSQ